MAPGSALLKQRSMIWAAGRWFQPSESTVHMMV